MAKKTLLQIVQSVLSSMNSDSVNSISDLEESFQIAEKAQEVYEDLMALEEWEHLRCLIQLESLSDNTRPNYLRIPDTVAKTLDIKYDKQKLGDTRQKYEHVEYMHPDEFIEMCILRDSSQANIVSVQSPNSNVSLLIKNDIAPSYWTTFDNEHIVFDSYDSEIDTTLQQSKNMTRGLKETTFTLSDNFIPDLPSQMFPAYIQEVTRVCSLYFRESYSQNDERRAFRSLANMKNKSGRTKRQKIRYGRK